MTDDKSDRLCKQPVVARIHWAWIRRERGARHESLDHGPVRREPPTRLLVGRLEFTGFLPRTEVKAIIDQEFQLEQARAAWVTKGLVKRRDPNVRGEDLEGNGPGGGFCMRHNSPV